jgi:hypothetical protein
MCAKPRLQRKQVRGLFRSPSVQAAQPWRLTVTGPLGDCESLQVAGQVLLAPAFQLEQLARPAAEGGACGEESGVCRGYGVWQLLLPPAAAARAAAARRLLHHPSRHRRCACGCYFWASHNRSTLGRRCARACCSGYRRRASSPVGRNGALARSSSDNVMRKDLIGAFDELDGVVEALGTVEI